MTRLKFVLVAFVLAALTTIPATASTATLVEILSAQPDEVQARYKYRNPQDTLEFFGVEPGTTVVEVLPGGGWYTKILLPYLGADGKVIGADYAIETWSSIYSNEEFLASRETWAADWIADASGWTGEDGAQVDAFVLGSLPESMHGTVDSFLFIRAMHNLNYPPPEGAHLKAAIENAWDALKPGGIVGIVQHHARDEMPDAWAKGSNGYLKKGYVVALMEAAGFEFAGESDINANEKDQPTETELVWRLPPRFAGVEEGDTEDYAARQAIGESNRMTLKFVKP